MDILNLNALKGATLEAIEAELRAFSKDLEAEHRSLFGRGMKRFMLPDQGAKRIDLRDPRVRLTAEQQAVKDAVAAELAAYRYGRINRFTLNKSHPWDEVNLTVAGVLVGVGNDAFLAALRAMKHVEPRFIELDDAKKGITVEANGVFICFGVLHGRVILNTVWPKLNRVTGGDRYIEAERCKDVAVATGAELEAWHCLHLLHALEKAQPSQGGQVTIRQVRAVAHALQKHRINASLS